jgi:hypothetical protein
VSREKLMRVQCSWPGCNEFGWYEYSNQQDYRDLSRRFAKTPWKCLRHEAGQEVLSPSNPERVTVMTVEVRPDINNEHFFDGHHGLVSGEGFLAWAKDFPVGATLTITATIKLPEVKP